MSRFNISVSAARHLVALDPQAPELQVRVGAFDRHVGFNSGNPPEVTIEGDLSWLTLAREGETDRVLLPHWEAEALMARTCSKRLSHRRFLEIGEGLLLEHEEGSAFVKAFPKCGTAKLIALAASVE